MNSKKIQRRRRALERLQNQVTAGVKTVYSRETRTISPAKLTDSDVNRIKKEVASLELSLKGELY